MELHERAPRLKQEEIAQLVGAKQANVSVVLKKIHDAGLCECEVISFDSMLKTGNE
jgi:predicted XRE-type DNA-binding protein